MFFIAYARDQVANVGCVLVLIRLQQQHQRQRRRVCVITTFIRQTRRVGVRCDIQRAQRRPTKHRETRWLRTRKSRSLLPVILRRVYLWRPAPVSSYLSTLLSPAAVSSADQSRRLLSGGAARTVRRRSFLFSRDVNYFIWAVPPPSFREWGQTKWWNGVPPDHVRPQL